MRFSFDFARNRYHSGGIDAFFIRFRPKLLSFGRNRYKKMSSSPESLRGCNFLCIFVALKHEGNGAINRKAEREEQVESFCR